ncbi:hypothetical protein DFH27DRAFT_221913 [Peziza echinospora]|nr:hypothetical protein DFH27DRAFT_221913 [Peziza echinospora]
MDYHTPSPWGTLIGEDKKARPLLQSLYRAIVHHIIYEIQPRTVRSLTPEKLAAFYREVGGDLDALFLNTDSLTISNVFTTLGCVHSLLPDPKDDFAPPQVPALHPRGFERWQTIQLLMEPDEHAEYMQQAVLRLGLLDPETQDSFSDLGPIPREAFPAEQDAETLEWHKNVFLKRIRDDEEREKAAAEEGQKQRGGAAAPGGGGAEDAGEERNVHAEEAEELDMRPERMRRPYSRSHSRHSSGDHTPYGGYSSSYDGRGRSPMPPAAADRAYSRPRHASQYSQRYATPDPPDADDRDRARSRKGSHVHPRPRTIPRARAAAAGPSRASTSRARGAGRQSRRTCKTTTTTAPTGTSRPRCRGTATRARRCQSRGQSPTASTRTPPRRRRACTTRTTACRRWRRDMCTSRR